MCSIPCSSSSEIVCANARAVTDTSQPRACIRRTSGAKMGTWGELVRSIQTRTGVRCYAAAEAAPRTAFTTSRCCSSASVGNIGSASPSRDAASVTGSDPSR